MPNNRIALVIGATGLVGSELVKQLCIGEHYQQIKVIARRSLSFSHPKLEVTVCHFDNITSEHLHGVQDVFCCIGTTIKKAGSRPAFEQVDYHYPLTVATFAKQQQAEHFLVITAMGANESSPIFYNHVKGKLENRLIALSFERLSILRPSLLTGERPEVRTAEKLGEWSFKVVNPLLIGPFRKFRSIQGAEVAQAMKQIALVPSKQQVTIYSSAEIAKKSHFQPNE
ncbi:NAD(P)H-binding protein [Paenibacillus yanchengensis]|uniref:NAD(P)H-binding protein n=1 Tax=Paenibacillus yanchengensis TaxID=2035833 RepID=A0ABW4YNC0_9BACL